MVKKLVLGLVASGLVLGLPQTTDAASTKTKINAVVGEAKKHRGKNYKYGAEGAKKFDCSGLVKYSFKKRAGLTLPRTSKDQAKKGKKVSKKNLKKGDLVFFDTKNASNKGAVTHAGIYLGSGKFISAENTKNGIRISDINSKYWKPRFVTGRRVLN